MCKSLLLLMLQYLTFHDVFSHVSRKFIVLFAGLFLLNACAGFKPAQMNVEEVFYIAVASGENTNYFRITIKAKSELGVAAYESGWFPSSAVDRLYGSGDSDTPQELVEKQELHSALDIAYKNAYTAYVEAASNPNTSEEEIARKLRAIKRVRSVPGDGIVGPDGAKEIEYDPMSNRTLRHAGEKFVIAFTSNPNDVLESIKSVAASNDTGSTILKLSKLLTFRNSEDTEVLKVERINAARFTTLLATRLASIHRSIDVEEVADSANIEEEFRKLRTDIESLLILSESTL